MLLTAELLLHYQRCHRRAFLELYGNKQEQDPPNDFQLKLQRDRLTHQKTVLGEQTYHRPDYPEKDWQAGAQATLSLMRQGVERIYKGVLIAEVDQNPLTSNESATPITLLSFPDLLVKHPGNSIFGNWCYVPVQIELGKRPKQEYKITAAFHAFVLTTVQGVQPPVAWLNLRERKPYLVHLENWLLQMQKICQECSQTLQQNEIPELFISRQKCNLCHWYSFCYNQAKSQEHLSLLPGVTPNRYSYLQQMNINTVESLAKAEFTQLETFFGQEITEQLLRQSQAKLNNQVLFNTNSPVKLPTSDIELYFDIESQPEIDFAYLLGVLVVDKKAQSESFYPLLGEDFSEEMATWQQFLNLVWDYRQAPIFHFCDYEVFMIKELAKRYKTPNHLWQPLLNRLVDVHEKVTQAVTLPTESYSLKAIARWLGFNWRNPLASGSQAICWYDEWLKTGDRTFLEKIVIYNQDDCLATYLVKDWLAKTLEENHTP
ncbi:recombinase B [[Phormidium ambiguum] IAM M-71]|uniref:Recombinase B n=1 Tax=[Phormidium ambiguum] IAM M-71 TaxID=454136 RepID=A0A1U7IEZ6_9CYAN|nr:TM0106 family RecB-like putative nuclease [Phormidium ambiguum]OKH35568.1 recombinase B [Phormidium ambiguum IAM M-71]